LAQGDPDGVTVEKFAQNGGHLVAGFGALVVVAMVVGWALDPDEVALWVLPLALVIALAIWTSMLRPRVLVQGSSLVLRNMVTTVWIPLAAVEELAVRQVMAVRTGNGRYFCAGVGRTLRQAVQGSGVGRARAQAGGFGGEILRHQAGGLGSHGATVAQPGIVYADYVETRLRELVKQDRERRGLKALSPEVEALAAQSRRELAWPELGALALSVLLFGLAVLFA
jgi:hypothetical protein